MDMKVSVVMAAFLGDYPNSATDKVRKFHRAIDSFHKQTYPHSELIIISDGCPIAEAEFLSRSDSADVVFRKIRKQPLFSGMVREEGLRIATGGVVCYLDADDKLGDTHLETIANGFKGKDIDWAYYNDLLYYQGTNGVTRNVSVEYGSIGTSTIAHKNIREISWEGCDGYGHDWKFIEQLVQAYPKYEKLYGCSYYVCHTRNDLDR